MFLNKYIRKSEKIADYGAELPAPLFRREFSVEKELKSANILISGLGFYRLFINGRDITRGELSPYISNPDDIVYYDSYDLMDLLKKDNALGVILGNGLQNPYGGSVWDFDKARWRAAPQLAFIITLEFTDGETRVIESDTSVKTADSAVIMDELRRGMFYDARREINGWSEFGFDDSDWSFAQSAPNPRGEFRLCDVDPIRVTEELAPAEIIKRDGGFLFKYAKNGAGTCRLKINASAGQKITLYFSDQLTDDGGINMDPISFVQSADYVRESVQKDIYICKDGEQEFVPFFTYHGYQYIFAEGLEDSQAVPETLTYLVMHSDIAKRGEFYCSDDTTNKLQAAMLRSDLTNFFHFPNDCPHREKNGWTADAMLSAEQMLMNFAPERNYREWLRNICKAQADDGSLPGIVPTGGWGFAWGNGPAWDNVLIYLPYLIYKYRGDKQVLLENAPSIMRYLNYIEGRRDSDGLIEIGLGDWCQANRFDSKTTAPLIVTDSILTCDIARKAAFIFGELGMTLQQRFADGLAAEIKSAVRKHLVDFSTMTVLGSCQTSQAMGIYYDIFEEGEKPEAFRVLIDMIHSYGDFLDIGVLGIKPLFRTLAERGETSLAFKMITRDEYPSFGHWVNSEGATTMFEGFRPVTERTPRPLSYNHHFWGEFGYWYYRYLAGINYNPFADDLTRLDIEPHFIKELSEVKAYHDCPYGRIEVKYKKFDGYIELTVNAPDILRGRIKLQKDYLFSFDFDGRVLDIVDKNGKKYYSDMSQLPLKSGVYKIVER